MLILELVSAQTVGCGILCDPRVLASGDVDREAFALVAAREERVDAPRARLPRSRGMLKRLFRLG